LPAAASAAPPPVPATPQWHVQRFPAMDLSISMLARSRAQLPGELQDAAAAAAAAVAVAAVAAAAVAADAAATVALASAPVALVVPGAQVAGVALRSAAVRVLLAAGPK